MSSPRPKSTAIDRQETFLRRVERKTNANQLHPMPRISRAAGFAQLLAFPGQSFVFRVDEMLTFLFCDAQS